MEQSQKLVIQQIDRAIEKAREIADNSLARKTADIANAYSGGLLTTGEFIDHIDEAKARNPKELQELRDAEIILLALCNAKHIIASK